jgi:hypothetical protein
VVEQSETVVIVEERVLLRDGVLANVAGFLLSVKLGRCDLDLIKGRDRGCGRVTVALMSHGWLVVGTRRGVNLAR